jgi:DNA-binding MarR family transcriptional regulator
MTLTEEVSEQLRQLQMLMHRAVMQKFAQSGGFHNPHRGQGRVLAALKIKPEISQKELTYLLNMSRQSLAELLAKLEKNGYITREPSKTDRRVSTIKLTEEGAKAAENLKDNTTDMEILLDSFSEEELETFHDLLGRLIANFEEKFPGCSYEERRAMVEQFMSMRRRGGYPPCHDTYQARGFTHSRGDDKE